MLCNRTEGRCRLNKARMVGVAGYSRDCLQALRRDIDIDIDIRYDARSQGALQLFRTQKQLDATAKDIEIMQHHGVRHQLLGRSGYPHYGPALADAQHKFVGALRLPGDETGNCSNFTHSLARKAQALGTRRAVCIQCEGPGHQAE